MAHWRKIFLVAILLLVASLVEAKPFKRVLVVSGGGMNPGFSVGVVAGLQSMGWRPDLVISTCGASTGSSIVNSASDIRSSFDLLVSQEHHHLLRQFVVETPNGLEMMSKLKGARRVNVYPDIFTNNLLWGPETIPDFLKNNEFNRGPDAPRMIYLSARALFGPQQVGQRRAPEPLFQQVYFTDPETAQWIRGRKLKAGQYYPYTTLREETETYSDISILTAMRAGIADPYLLNPGLIDGEYFFTGAVDLYPLDLAVELGDEVIATYPSMLFEEFEDNAIEAAFGFRQTQRALEAIQHRDVKWIDQWGADKISFNPQRQVIVMTNGVPESYSEFYRGVVKQWDLGLQRAKEALRAAPKGVLDVRSHLIRPINPLLLKEFSCKNAYEWKTDQRTACVSDQTSGCDRRQAKYCRPIR